MSLFLHQMVIGDSHRYSSVVTLPLIHLVFLLLFGKCSNRNNSKRNNYGMSCTSSKNYIRALEMKPKMTR